MMGPGLQQWLRLLPLLAAVVATPLAAQERAVVVRLGHLNGVALECKYLEQSQRIRRAVGKAVAGNRSLLNTFREATDEGFMQAVRLKGQCPAQPAFSRQVDSLIGELGASGG